MKKLKSLLYKYPNLIHTLPIYLLYLLPFTLIIPLRVTGLIQPFEWLSLDTVLRLRPTEQQDQRIVIIGIDDDDIKYLDRRKELVVDSISDSILAETIEQISAYHPAAIGIDIIRDRPIGDGRSKLEQVTHSHQNIIENYKAYEPDPSPPSLELPPDQIGFVDSLNDSDGRDRRAIIAEPKSDKYSLAYHLTRLYLKERKIEITSAADREIKFSNGKTLTSLNPAPGKYDRQDINHFQTLINYRNNRNPFQVISLQDILTNRNLAKSIENKIVLIGYTATSRGDFSYTNSITDNSTAPANHQSKLTSIISGVESHAHVTSQLISYVLDNRVNLMPLNDPEDLVWLIFCILMGLFLPKAIGKLAWAKSTSILLTLSLFTYLFIITSLIFLLIMLGIWVPIAATFLSFIVSAPILATIQEREYQLTLIAGVRLTAIQITFEQIHAVPLQTINEYQQKLNLSSSEAHAALHQIGEQIRQISTKLEEQYSHEVKFLAPLRELLNTEFEKQLDKPKFKWLQSLNINNYVVDFDEVKDDSLTSDHKVQICNFMIEAICNIDKYAISVSTVWITSKVEGDYCLLEIRDNGKATIDLNRKGYGVRSAEKLGKKLKGKFWRESLTPHGYRCTLSWKYVN